ncbi:Acid-sensing ion channel [Seminavis robusta]|uniref:Acid-sensing ion channel n=1 Tax=Seminavis robusta TaxID=568900 RepID=A0A9N8HLN5_9STRA|nr:Acid-sensing ion channel [Seminavis robusta]|eukprot:Sro1047_g235140.1 Acid-sensing ion channel (512) ;mRNA; r:17621-19156
MSSTQRDDANHVEDGKQEDVVVSIEAEEKEEQSKEDVQEEEEEEEEEEETKLLENGRDTYFPDPRLDDASLLEVIAWWSEFTSIHGVYYMFERGHFSDWLLYAWSALVVACTISLIATLVVMIQEYKEFKVNTSLTPVIPASLPFPQVTVCNTNMFQTSLMDATGIEQPTDEEEFHAISQPLQQFIPYALFNGLPIPIDDLQLSNETNATNTTDRWTPTITANGRCFTFQTNKEVVKPGSGAGLRFGAWLNQSNYMDTTVQAGLLVFVTQPGTTTISDQTRQVLVPPGASAFLGLSRLDEERITEWPWQTCEGTTTTDVCRTSCLQEFSRVFCGCRQYGDPDTTLPYCKSQADENNNNKETNETQELCILQQSGLEDEFLKDSCDCPVPCTQQLYSVSFSFSQLSRNFAQQLAREFNYTDDAIPNNLVDVVVNMNTIRYDLMEESKDKSFSSLISDLGGQMGFFMGISLISIVELFGELIGLRILPRFFCGDRRLYGVGQRRDYTQMGVVR